MLSRIFGISILALLVTVTLGGNLTAQPFFTPASGCKEGAVLTLEQALNPGTGGFTQDRTLNPGEDTTAVLGAWLVVDGFTADPATGSANCFISPGDGNPLYVTKLSVRPVSGDPVAAGVKTLTFWLDNDFDGFLSPGKDIQLSGPMDASCLTSAQGCVLSFGNTPIFGGLAGLSDIPGSCVLPSGIFTGVGGGFTGGCAGIIIVAEISNPKPQATLQVRMEGFASDIVNNVVGGPFSSDFSPSYKKQASNIRLVIESGGTIGPGLLNAVNNGSGNPETGVKSLGVSGIRTRDDRDVFTDRNAKPSDREYIVGFINFCEGSEPVTTQLTILPAIAAAAPTVAGFPGVATCVGLAATDGLPTNIVRVRVGVTGPGSQFVQSVHVYTDLGAGAAIAVPGTGGVLFEPGELILSAIPVNGIATVGSLEQTLVTSGGTPLIVPDGTGSGFAPLLFYITADIDDRAFTSNVQFQVAIDVADIPGTTSSRLLRSAVQTFDVQITGGTPPGPTTASLVISSVTNPKKPAKSMTYKNVFVSATGPAGASKVVTGFSVPGCTVKKVTGPVGATAVVGGAPVGPFKVKVKCATKPATVPGLVALRAGGSDDGGVPSLIPLRAGSVGTVEVFTLSGKKVLESGFTNGALDVNKLDLPNGVYLYVVTVQGPDGRSVKSELRKFVVMR